jgi:branched-chain amino acid transport system permease protein
MSIEIALVGVVGGWQTVLGPTIGSILLSPSGELVRAYLGGTYAGLHLLLYGLLIMVVVLFMPNGLNDPLVRLFKRWDDGLRGTTGGPKDVLPPDPGRTSPLPGRRES